MLSTTFLPLMGPLNSTRESSLTSSLTHQLQRNASSLFVAATGISCDLSPQNLSKVTECSALTTEMGCSPPRTSTPTHVYYMTGRLTVPATALSSRKTRRRRSGAGGGGDDELWNDGGDGGFGGGDDGDDYGGRGDDEGPFDDSLGRWAKDVMLLWSFFCAWSLYSVAHHMSKPVRTPTPAFASVSVS